LRRGTWNSFSFTLEVGSCLEEKEKPGGEGI
jgi:hypothetical protein